MRGNQRIENLTIRNSGAETLVNPHIEGPSLSWLMLTVDKNIGDIPAGESRTVGILIKPGEIVAQGVYDDRIVIQSDNHIPYTFNIQVTVTSSATGNAQFSVMDELMKNVAGASVTVQNQSIPELIQSSTADANGALAFFDLPEGRYSYNVSAAGHKSYGGSFVVVPGVTTGVAVALEVNLVSIEWSVTPVTIEDIYQITVSQTFETNVPTSVIVTEPPAIKLPELAAGQSYNGELTITNYGLIAADYAGISFPSGFDDYDLEVSASGVPSSLGPNEKVVVPFRITRHLQSASNGIAEEVTGFGGGSCSGSQSITTTWTQTICPNSPNERKSDRSSTSTIYWNTCSVSGGGGTGGGGGGGIYNGGGGGGGQSGGGGSGGGNTTPLPGNDEECFSPSALLDRFLCGTRECSGSSVVMANGTYDFSEPDLRLPARGFPIDWTRNYRSNRVMLVNGSGVFAEPADGPLGYGWMTTYFSRIENGNIWVDGQGFYQPFNTDSSGNLIANLEEGTTLKKTSDGYELIKIGSGVYYFHANGKLSALKDLAGNTVTLAYNPDGKLIQVKDTGGRVALSFAYNPAVRISSVTDAANRIVNYEYDVFGNLVTSSGPTGTHTYTYNSNHGITSKADSLGETYTIEYKYPAKGVVKRILDPTGTAKQKQGLSTAGHEMTYTYDFGNRIFYVSDYNGNKRKKAVNSSGALVSEVLLESSGNTVIRKIDYQANRVEKITDSAGITTTIQRDEWYNIIKVTDGAGNTTSATYNSSGLPLTLTDPLGVVTRFDYDSNGNVVRITKAVGKPEQQVVNYTYDQYGQITKAAIGNSTTSIAYDDQGQPIRITDPLGNATQFEFDLSGKLVTSIDPLNHRREYGRDQAGNLTNVKDPLGNITGYTYNAANRLASVKDPLGRVTTITKDFRGHTTEIADPLNNRGTFDFDGNGKLTKITSGDSVITLARDSLNRLKSITDPEGNTTTFDYASAGCPSCGISEQTPKRVTDPLGNVTTNIFDNVGRITGYKDALGNETNITRDVGGRPVSTSDANGKTATLQYDGLGRIIRKTDANGGKIDYGYDANGNLASLTDPTGNTTRFEYDLAGRKTRETRPMGQATEYTYYANGLLKTVKDAKNQTTSYSYDAANRLTEITYADGARDNFGYDATGSLTSYAKTGVSGTIVYDELGRKISETVTMGGFTKSYSYTYDTRGNKTTYVSPEGKQYNYSYNRSNQLTSIGFDGKTISFDYQWIRKTKATLPNNVVTNYSYNANNWLSAIETKQNSATLSAMSYQFDKVGNVTGKTSDAQATSYGYDWAYQLINSSNSLNSETFTYDQNGNRTNSGGTYNANNELTGNATTVYAYDANGNTISKTTGGQTTAYVYDAGNKLVQVTLPDGRTVSYGYDPFGRRVSKTINGATTYYLYSDRGLIGEYSENGTNRKAYTWKPNGLWGTNPVTLIDNGATYYYHNDRLGTPRKITDVQGNIVWSATYDAFGKAAITTATVTSNLRNAGQQYEDEETGLYYNLNRYYDPENGRYLQVDPMGFAAGDVNLYRYVFNNPANAIDPLGLLSCDGWQIASNLAAGFGDGITFDLTAKLRRKLGTDNMVNKCSGLYKVSHFGGEMLGGYLLGAGLAKAGGFFLGKLGPYVEDAWLFAKRTLGNEIGAVGTDIGEATAQVFENGELFEHSFNTLNGTVDMIAETVIEGSTLHLKDIAIYARNKGPIEAGLKAIMQQKNVLVEAARTQGFKVLEITGQRVLNSTSANPGKYIHIVIDLLK